MSARNLWIIFTILVIILMEVLVVPRLVEVVLSKELVSMSIPLRELESSLREVEARVPSHIADKAARAPDDIATNEDMTHIPFMAQWRMMTLREPAKALSYAIGLSIAGLLGGILLASIAFRHLLRFGERLSGMSSIDKIAVLIGLVIGLLITLVILPNILPYIHGPVPLVGILIAGIVTYLSIWAMMSMKDEVKSFFPGAGRAELDREFQKPKILDTNVIIDGRIADICRSGFIEGQIVVPSFILEELQHIADSEDSLKRARGRRGLDILNQMRKEFSLTVRQCDLADPDNHEEVDARLVTLAQEVDGYIVTNDFNLNKVAELQDVVVLNINELANALKPVVLPGEEMTVSVVKEGKEANQGIAYLDDGTMVVIESGRKQIGQTVDVIVTSVLQTVAGKMIFSNLKAVQEEEDDLIGRNVRNYSGFRPRKKAR